MSTREAAGRVRPPWVLWDLQNCGPGAGQASATLRVLLAAVGPVDLVLAASSLAKQLERCRADLEDCGVVFVDALDGYDRADLALLAHAARCSAGEMVVVCDDWRFATLAEAGHRIVALSRRPEQVARRLAAVAGQVLRFDPPPSRPRASVSKSEEGRRRAEPALTAEFRRALNRRRELRPRGPDPRVQRRHWHAWLREWTGEEDDAAPGQPVRPSAGRPSSRVLRRRRGRG